MRDLPLVHKTMKGGDLNDANLVYLVLNAMNQAPGSVHAGMFVKCIEIMGTDNQHKQYLDKCRTYEIVGCYAQT